MDKLRRVPLCFDCIEAMWRIVEIERRGFISCDAAVCDALWLPSNANPRLTPYVLPLLFCSVHGDGRDRFLP